MRAYYKPSPGRKSHKKKKKSGNKRIYLANAARGNTNACCSYYEQSPESNNAVNRELFIYFIEDDFCQPGMVHPAATGGCKRIDISSGYGMSGNYDLPRFNVMPDVIVCLLQQG